eukprot:6229915-Prymnesium_polylepis.1
MVSAALLQARVPPTPSNMARAHPFHGAHTHPAPPPTLSCARRAHRPDAFHSSLWRSRLDHRARFDGSCQR